MGTVAAEGIFKAFNEEGTFGSVEELRKRAKIGNSTVELLNKFNCLKGLPQSNQLSFFDIL